MAGQRAVQKFRKLDDEVAAPAPLMELIRPFWPRFRRALWEESAASPEFRDLLSSFPAACVEIVCRPADDPARIEAMRLLKAGRPLKEIAAALGLPPWFRKLRADAFVEPTLGRLTQGALDSQFGTRVLSLVPSGGPLVTGNWLKNVLAARAAYDDEFALWLAAQRHIYGRSSLKLPIQHLALFAFHSKHPDGAAARHLKTRWNRKISLSMAASEARRWLLAVLEEDCLCGPGCSDARGLTSVVDGYSFVPLITPDSIIEDGSEMKHCLGQYVSLALSGISGLYSIRKDGRRVATLEVRAFDSVEAPRIHQLKGVRNSATSPAVNEAVLAWLRQHHLELDRQFRSPVTRHSNDAFHRLVWRPYARALAVSEGLAKAPARPPIGRILMQMRDLWALEKSQG